MDIRLYTRCIVHKNGQFLQGRRMLLGELIWNSSPWDAWATRRLADAASVARKVGGTVVLFNPIIGRTAPLRTERRLRDEMRAVS